MISFFNVHISPSSPSRAKLAVHMLAQKKVATAAMSSKDQHQTMFELLKQFLLTQDVHVDPALLEKRLGGIDINNAASFMAGLNTYLVQDVSVSADKAESVVTEANLLMPTALGRLGLQAQLKEPAVNGAPKENGVNGEVAAVAKSQSIGIEDVHAWKTGLQVSAGPRPVRALEEFEDLEAKL